MQKRSTTIHHWKPTFISDDFILQFIRIINWFIIVTNLAIKIKLFVNSKLPETRGTGLW